MSLSELLAILPLMFLGLTPVVMMLVVAFYRNHLLTALLALAGLGMSLAMLPVVGYVGFRPVTPLLVMDGYGTFFMGLILVASGVTAAISYDYFKEFSGNREEYYILLLLAAFGASVLCVAKHLAAMFLGLEILSVSLYALIAYPLTTDRQVEAGLKYLILAAVSSAFLIFGMALVYSNSGVLDLVGIGKLLHPPFSAQDNLLLLSGLAMIVVGMGFKLALVPFHLWTPDVYQGAPAPVAGFVATVSKGSMVALMVRFLSPASLKPGDSLYWMFAAMAVASMFSGNLLALLQNNVKRILAYSSIAHLGYIMVAFLAGGSLAKTAVAFYILAYFITALGAFGVVTLMSAPDKEAERIDDFRGLFWKRPWLGGTFSVMLFSLAGIPVTAGFMGKFYLVSSGVETTRWGLVLSLILTSTIGLFYYLRVVGVLFDHAPDGPSIIPSSKRLPTGYLILGVLVVFLLWAGVFPSSFIHLIHSQLF